MTPIKIFVSYSHKDRLHLDSNELMGGLLAGLESENVRFWIDNSLQVGDHWDEAIQAELQSSHIALLLVSQAFLDSRYCREVELSQLATRYQKGELRIFPVVLSACYWQANPWLAQHQMLPGGNETLEEHYCDMGPKKRMHLKIRTDLQAMIEEVQNELRQKEKVTEKPAEVNAELRTVTLLECSLSVDKKYGLDSEAQLEFLYEAAPLFKERCQAEIELLQGYVVDMSDSGQVLVCFGYPRAQELDSVKAVRVGLAILRAAGSLNDKLEPEWKARLTVRAGVHTGLVIGKTGAATQQQLENGQTSAITNLAMKSAPADTLVISQATSRLVAGFFTLEAHRDIAEPDSEDLIATWKVMADRGINTRFETISTTKRIPLVGRQRELALIQDRWLSAQEGRGQLVALSGEAGMGKSRLMQEVRKDFIRRGSQVFDCQSSLFTSTSPLFPVIKTLEKWLSFKETDDAAARLQKVTASVARSGLPPDAIVPYFAELLQLPHSYQELLTSLTPKQLKDRTLEAILSLLLQAASVAPLAIIIRDLHWMDSTTLECLDLLFAELPTAPVCVVVSARPEEFNWPPAWTVESCFSLVKLDPLNREDTAEMMRRLADGKALPREVFEAICRKAEGSPLLIEEFTHMVISSGLLLEQDDHYLLARPLEPLKIPDTLYESLMARLSKLEGGRVIAQIGAVLGREFSLELMQEVAPLAPEALKEVLGRLVNSGLFFRRGLLSKSVYLFRHALVQDALYESLLKKERKRYHERAALALEKLAAVGSVPPEALAFHFREAELYEPAVRYGILTAEKTAKDLANAETVRHVRDTLTALRHLPETLARNQQELQLQMLQTPALLALKGWSAPELGRAYHRAQELCAPDSPEQFRVNRGLWAYYMVSSQLAESLAISDQLMHAAEAADSDDLRLEAHASYADSYYWQGQPALAQQHAALGLSLYDLATHHLPHCLEFGEDPSVVMLCYSANSLRLLGRTEEAAAQVAYIEANLLTYTHLFSRGFLLFGLGMYYIHEDDPTRTLAYGTQLRALAQEQGFSQWLAVASTHCGWGKARLGQVDEGIREILDGIALFTKAGGVVTTAVSNYLVVDAYLHAERYEQALAHVNGALEYVAKVEERNYVSELLRQKAEILLALQGRSAEAESLLDQAQQLAQAQQAVLLQARTARTYDQYRQLAAAPQ